MGGTILSIVIVNYNVKYFLEQCLIAVRAATKALDTEIFVVDNHSTDGSVEYLRPRFPEVIFIENNDNPGFAKANNQAIHQCKGEYILLLNPDTVIGETGLHNICRFMDEHPEAGAIGVKMLNAHGIFLPESKRSFPTPWVSFCKLFGLSKCFPHSTRFASYSLPYLDPDKPHQVEVLSGAFMFLRHKAITEIGLLDESFFMYGEDIDLSYRIVLAGYQNYYLPERILHYKGESTKKDDRKYLNAFYNAMLLFYKKYYPRAGWFISGLIRSSIALRKGYAALLEKGKWSNRGSRGNRGKGNTKQRRSFICCNGSNFERIKSAITTQHFPLTSTFLPLGSLDGITDLRGVTDIIFCYPDISFDQILQFMNEHPCPKITYHIYHPHNRLFISPNY